MNKEDFFYDGEYIKMLQWPYLYGKIVRLKNPDRIKAYVNIGLNKHHWQVEGYNVFIIKSGFAISAVELTPQQTDFYMKQLCTWFYENKLINSKRNKTYKVKSSI